MANVAIAPEGRQLIVDVEDITMLKDIKKAIGMLRGVGKVRLSRRKKLSAYELSLRDLDEGRIFRYDSLDDFIKEIEG